MRIFIGTPEIDWILFKRGTRLTTPEALDGFRIFTNYSVNLVRHPAIGAGLVSLQAIAQQKSRVHRPAF